MVSRPLPKVQRSRVYSVRFPSKDFGNQEYGTEQETADFCRLTYGVHSQCTRQRTQKGKANPLFKGLAEAADGDYPSWNFHKYILDRNGNLIGSFGSFIGPSSKRLASHRRSALVTSEEETLN